jgi:hypothetical protein
MVGDLVARDFKTPGVTPHQAGDLGLFYYYFIIIMLCMSLHEERRITCDHRHSLWYLTGSLDCGLSRSVIRQWFVHDFVPTAAASRLAASASLSGESRTLHFDNSLSHAGAECSPCIALAQCALGCKPQMCQRLL